MRSAARWYVLPMLWPLFNRLWLVFLAVFAAMVGLGIGVLYALGLVGLAIAGPLVPRGRDAGLGRGSGWPGHWAPGRRRARGPRERFPGRRRPARRPASGARPGGRGRGAARNRRAVSRPCPYLSF